MTRALRPRTVQLGAYEAVVSLEEETPWGLATTWTIVREGTEVGKMFQGGGGYGDRVTCSMSSLVWSGDLPKGHVDPRTQHYGIHFDTGPCDTREAALAEFAGRADRLISWRESERVQ